MATNGNPSRRPLTRPSPRGQRCRSLRLRRADVRSRLIVGTGKYSTFALMREALVASGAEIVTVAVRRVNLTDRSKESLLDYVPQEMTSSRTPPAATTPKTRSARRGSAARWGCRTGSSSKSSATSRRSGPTTRRSWKRRSILVKEGFVVFPYTSDDPDRLPQARGSGSGGGHAARSADRIGPRNSEPQQHLDHPRARKGAR